MPTKISKKKLLKDVNKRIKRSQRIEAICRQLCRNDGIEPDKLVCKMMPAYVHYPIPTFYLPDPQHTYPAWRLFEDMVILTLDIIYA